MMKAPLCCERGHSELVVNSAGIYSTLIMMLEKKNSVP
jgi:hypothetical protein